MTLVPTRGGRWALGTDSPACTWVLRPTLSAGRESPVRGLPSALSSASLPWEPPGPWCPLTEQAGWGVVPPDQGSPCPSSSHRGRAERGGWGPWRLLPAVQAVRMEETWVSSRQRPQGVSSPVLGLPVTRLSHQRPHRKGNSLFLKAWCRPHDSPSVFLRRPFQMRTARLLPSANLVSVSASSSARPSAGLHGVLTVDGSPGPGCFGEDAGSCSLQG